MASICLRVIVFDFMAVDNAAVSVVACMFGAEGLGEALGEALGSAP
jgi:hypothetical protein